MPETANTIAYYFATKIKEAGRPVKRQTIINLVFYSHSWFLALTTQKLVEEPFIVTPSGPMILSLVPVRYDLDDEDILKFLDNFWSAFSNISDADLSKKVTEESIIKDSKPLSELTDDQIRTFFQKKEALISHQKKEAKPKTRRARTPKIL